MLALQRPKTRQSGRSVLYKKTGRDGEVSMERCSQGVTVPSLGSIEVTVTAHLLVKVEVVFLLRRKFEVYFAWAPLINVSV